ncbi:MAG: ABC transporter permease [Candidatus Doudnabacteria bacterium]|nr:ABC transporter permease [Candidatus Doudnabacteria bacterium]
MLTFFRIVKFAFATVWRNVWLSFATTLVMFLALFMVTVLILLNVLATGALEVVQDKVDLSVYFVSDATTEEVNVVRTQLQSRSDVNTITYISKEQALKDFEERHSDNPLIQSALDELENPLQPSLIVKANTPDQYSAISEFLTSEQFSGVIEDVNLDDNRQIVEKLTSTTGILSQLAVWVSLLFTIIAVLITFNTIRLAIYTQKDEISVMKLVGATRTLIRMPLVLAAAFYAVVAAALSTALLFPVVNYIGPRANAFLGEVTVDIESYFFDNFWLIFLAQFTFAVVLAVVSSSIAMRRYLKK